MITAYRPGSGHGPRVPGFADNVAQFGEITGEDVSTFAGLPCARIENRRAFFREAGATSTDHGHPTAAHRRSARGRCRSALRQGSLPGTCTPAEAELFRGQMLTEMARMSVDDGMVMQIHPGVYRNHNPALLERFGRDKGADIPIADRIRARAQAAARSLRQRAAADRSSSSRSTRRPTPASWRRSPAIIRR